MTIEEKILRYLQNDCTTDESEEVIRYLNDLDNDSEIRKKLFSLWLNNNFQLKSEELNFEDLLEKVHGRIVELPDNELANRFNKFVSISGKWLSRVAAILFLPLLLVTIWSFHHSNSRLKSSPVTWVELTTPTGAKTNFELPDGSHIWLNDGSKIKYPSQFEGNQREVKLEEGEAFFSIAKDESKPFIVSNRNASVKVTGTTFNIRAYPEDELFEATLNTGKIELEIHQSTVAGRQKLLMKPGEQISVHTITGKIENKMVDANAFNAWINGKLLFRDTPFDEAIRKLDRWYNADIQLITPELKNILITATFKEEKLSQALELLSFATPIKYKISERKRKEDGTYTKQVIIISKR